MSNRNSRYFQTLEFIFYISKGILALALLAGFIGFVIIPNYYEPTRLIEATTVAEESTNIFFIESQETLVSGRLNTQKFDYNVMELATTSNYCEISDCKTIKCSSIPAAHDPGNVTSNFIKSVFKVRCPTTDTINLIYKNCKFPSNAVGKNWLMIDISIEQLTFEGCALNRIDDDAFSEKIFAEVETLSIINNKVSSLNRMVFSKFFKLNQLLVQNNIIDYAESNLLMNVASSLEVLQLEGAIKDREVLRNITGEKILSNLKLLSIRDNFIAVLGPDLFVGIPKIRSLYIESSGVTEIRLNSFAPMASTLELLILKSNQISTLPNGIFNFVLSSKRQFRVSLTENSWHCDCELKWIQEFIESYPSVISDIPECTTPEFNAQLSFRQARFCNENNTDTSTTENIEITSQDQNDSSTGGSRTVAVFCSDIISNNFQSPRAANKTFLSVDYEFPARSQNFFLTELSDGTVMVDLPDLQGNVLLWFDNQMQSYSQGSVNCVKNVKVSFTLKNTSPSTTYTVCLSDNQEDGFSPLNCLGITTKPELNDRTWLTNGYKTMVYTILICLTLFLCAISALSMFIAIRRHPTLLRGSKRVLLIKHRKVEAMILPKGVEFDVNGKINETNVELQSVKKRLADKKFYTEDGYVIPIPPNKPLLRKDSRISRISFQSYGTGYVSGIEPAFWRFNRSKSEIGADEMGPPPLPPHPQRAIPSVSMAIDSANIEDDENDLHEII